MIQNVEWYIILSIWIPIYKKRYFQDAEETNEKG